MEKKNLFILLIIVVITLLTYYISPSYAIERTYPRFPKLEFSFKKARWSILFNAIYPRARFVCVVKNITPKDDIDINEGVLILEITEDKGLNIEPNKEEFEILEYRLFDTIRPGKQLNFSFTLSEEYKPGRFRIKPTLVIYPKGKSPVKPLHERMKNLGKDVLHTWEYVYFSEWKENLTKVLGAEIIEYGSHLITIHRFYEVLGGTGISFIAIVLIAFKYGRKLIIKLFKKRKL